MDDEYFGEISLNLVTETDSSLYGKKKKVYGDRSSRVQQRKETKQRNDSTQYNNKQNNDKTGEKRKWKEGNTAEGTADKHGGKKRKPDVFISSLFRKNPVIPQIPSAEVDTVAENVFTGQTFRDLPLHPYLVSNLEEKQGFNQMTEVQKMAIPVLLRKKDALIKSQTGSGKTLSYAVPIVQSLQSRKVKIKRDDGPYALIIVPTRELALQSYETFAKLLRPFIWIVPGCLMGGEKRKAEKSRLRKGVNILVATPGRLMDHIKTTTVLTLARIQWLVIDEADRMLELGYERDVAQILNCLKSQCSDSPQTVLLSATLSEGVERLSSITLNNPEHISVTEPVIQTQSTTPINHSDSASKDLKLPHDEKTDKSFSVPSQLKQHFIVTPCKLRLVTLAALILWKCKYSKPASKIIVFFSTQDSVEFHNRLFTKILLPQKDIKKTLSELAGEDEDVGDSDEDDYGSSGHTKDAKSGLKLFRLHGEMPQKDRTQMFNEFSHATSGVLLCTDVVARGIDLPYVDWIIQYTSPGATVDYIHRVGRTARAGTKGQSLLFLMPSEVGYLQELNKHKISLSQMQISTILKHLLANISDLPQTETSNTNRQKPRTEEEAATFLQDRAEECILHDKSMQSLAGRGFQSYIRAYATYSKEVKDIFKVSDLHLGHVAKSYALREAPTKVHGVTAKFGVGQKKNRRVDKPGKKPLSFKQATLSESSSGFHPGNRKVWAKPGGKMARKKK
uniref:ATP-dependent RNA helicase n=1 Tax=Arion vulgaris TaxID=1028688 RepID=A0A0B7AQR0_9EUPU